MANKKDIPKSVHYKILREKLLECLRYTDNEMPRGEAETQMMLKLQESILWLDKMADDYGWKDYIQK